MSDHWFTSTTSDWYTNTYRADTNSSIPSAWSVSYPSAMPSYDWTKKIWTLLSGPTEEEQYDELIDKALDNAFA